MSAATHEPTLDDISAAMAMVDGKTPRAVVDAFLTKPVVIHGCRMVPYKAGHDLIFSDLGHPWTTGAAWEGRDVLLALFVCSHTSRELFSMLEEDAFEPRFFEFIENIPAVDLVAVCRDLVKHLAKTRATGLPMENPHSTGQKKTADSGGFSTRLLALAGSIIGRLTKCCTRFRSLKSSL